MGQEIRCTACRLRSAYNRAVVDTVREETLGCLCTRCIEDFFGSSLASHERSDATCLLCDRDGLVALPKWHALTVRSGGDVRIRGVDYTITPRTPRLCDRHLSDLRQLRDGDGTGRASREV